MLFVGLCVAARGVVRCHGVTVSRSPVFFSVSGFLARVCGRGVLLSGVWSFITLAGVKTAYNTPRPLACHVLGVTSGRALVLSVKDFISIIRVHEPPVTVALYVAMVISD